MQREQQSLLVIQVPPCRLDAPPVEGPVRFLERTRVAAHEILVNTPAVANLIRQGKLDQLENAMQSGAAHGMRLMDSTIQELLEKGVINGKEAYKKAINKAKFESVKDIG